MKELAIVRMASAYDPPLSIGRILNQGVPNAPAQEIVYGDRLRYTHSTLAERVARLASPLAALGVKRGCKVAMLTQRYLHEPGHSEELWRGGWLHTGDVGVIDSEGYLKIVDRIKDVVKTGGEWVSSLDLEDIILRVPGIAEAAVIGVPDDKWGERPIALVVQKPDAATAPTEDAIRKHVNEFAERGAISRYAVPDRVYFVDTIPKTSVGKLDKKVIRAKLPELAATRAARLH